MPDARLPARSRALDDQIMETNTSSIVSKRSVERLYYPDEPHFFRYFVKKPQRRAPLINRGYWLRLKAIDVIVRQFLNQEAQGSGRKVIVNLGCGSDVLPWHCHSRYGSACDNVLFIDVDYPDLMRKKRAIVQRTPQLRDLLGSDFSSSESETDSVLLRSAKYCLLACDLRDLDSFRTCLESVVCLDDTDILFVAEVSLTYMDTASADALIRWASSISHAEFCLLEQILPHGSHHPFAKAMLAHYDKLSTPPRSVHQYPTVDSQRSRFQCRGWQGLEIWDMWDVWSDNGFVTAREREDLDQVEPFDEWEEFMLFGRHYFVLHATAAAPSTKPPTQVQLSHSKLSRVDIKVKPGTSTKALKRRFGNSLILSDVYGRRYGAHLWGLGVEGRPNTFDLFALDSGKPSCRLPQSGPAPRMCATLTDLGDHGILLVGGRASPSKAFSDCWLLTKGSDVSWKRLTDLPIPLFRHSTVRLRGSSMALTIGGKTASSQVLVDSFLFRPERGWLRCDIRGPKPEPVFGAVACNSSTRATEPGIFEGMLSGGIKHGGLMSTRKYIWRVDATTPMPVISYHEIYIENDVDFLLTVCGAEVVELPTCTAICGGMGSKASLQGQHITFVSISNDQCRIVGTTSPTDSNQCWPFMIGSSVAAVGSRLLCFGGGATCFGGGATWETVPYQLELPDEITGFEGTSKVQSKNVLEYLESPRVLDKAPVNAAAVTIAGVSKKATITTIPRIKLDSSSDFQDLLRKGKPVVIEGADLGRCISSWKPDYLVDKIGRDKQFVVHECQNDTEKMDFNSKNFKYITDSFGNIMHRIEAGGRLYLRSLSHAKPTDAPANVDEDFPAIADDFCLPRELNIVRENLFSSILRVSGRVNMWLHYDVMANVYAQVQGSKRMILFPPSDVTHLSFAPGASSSSLDVFSALETPALAPTHPHEAHLEPGDVLLLPPMWLHTATPTSHLSVAVNVFFRDLEDGYSTGRDVYGNRDLAAYEKGRQDVARMAKSLEKLPREVRRFYASRLADELVQHAYAG